MLLVTTIPSSSKLISLHFTQTLYLHFPQYSWNKQSVFIYTTHRYLCMGRKSCSLYGTTWIFKYNVISTNLIECIPLSCQSFSNNTYNWSVKSIHIYLITTAKSRPLSGQYILFVFGATAPSGPGPPHSEVSSSHTTTQHS